jgi:NAD(P)-dependent dehydrogenase (short-subunit alcohol dehydrogenase family)
MAARIVANPPKTLRLAKRLLREGQQQRLSDVLELSAAFQALAHETKDHGEALDAFFDKREPKLFGGVDLTSATDATRAIDAAHAHHGAVDVLVNIAGAFRWQTVSDGDAETWDFLQAVNVKTALNNTRAALPHLPRSGGRIINIGANAALKAGAGMGPYAASKASASLIGIEPRV